jgi:hypothetical protein
MPHALTPATPLPTLDEARSQEDGPPVTLGYTPDQMPVVVWPRGDDPVLEVGCVQIRLFRLTEGLRAGLAECLQMGPSHRGMTTSAPPRNPHALRAEKVVPGQDCGCSPLPSQPARSGTVRRSARQPIDRVERIVDRDVPDAAESGVSCHPAQDGLDEAAGPRPVLPSARDTGRQ